MPYHIKKLQVLLMKPSPYFMLAIEGGRTSMKTEFSMLMKQAANAVMNNPDGKNGGWRKATVHAE